MAENETVLILDDDRDVTETLAMVLEQPGRTIVTCEDLASARALLQRVPVSVLLSDIHLSNPFVYEGLELAEELRRRRSDTRVLMMTAHASEELVEEATRRGAAAVLEKPFSLDSLKRHFAVCEKRLGGDGAAARFRMPSLDSIIGSRELVPSFQPIVDLQNQGQPYGFESLARFRGEIPFCDCDFLFRYAGCQNRIAEFDLACLKKTMLWGAPLARSSKLFINIHPQLLSSGTDLRDTLCREAEDQSVPLDHLVLEITEQEKLADIEAAIDCIEELRARGVEFALDDIGMSYSHLDLIDRIKPSYLKISQHFGTGFESDAGKRKIVKNIVALAADFDCDVIVEGIEEAETSGAAKEAGARFGQGFLYSEPKDVSAFTVD